MKTLLVPLYRQGVKTAYCVPYAVRGIAKWYGIRLSKAKSIKIFNTHKTRGTGSGDILNGIKKVGLKLHKISFNYESVRQSIKECSPIVICYVSDKNESHFSTIVGVAKRRGLVYYTLSDTYYGVYEIPGNVLKLLMDTSAGMSGEKQIWIRKVTRRTQ